MSRLDPLVFKIKYLVGSDAPERRLADLKKLFNTFLKEEERQRARSIPECDQARGEVCLALNALARAVEHDPVYRDVVLLLFQLPPFGPLLALHLFQNEKTAALHFERITKALDPALHLYWANLILLSQDHFPQPLQKWAKLHGQDDLPKSEKYLPEFLSLLLTTAVPLSPSMRSAILGMGFVQSLVDGLRAQEHVPNLTEIAELTTLLRAPALVERLGAHIPSLEPDELIRMLELLRHVPSPISPLFLKMVQKCLRHTHGPVVIAAIQLLILSSPEDGLNALIELVPVRNDLANALIPQALLLPEKLFQRFTEEIPLRHLKRLNSLGLTIIRSVDPEGLKDVATLWLSQTNKKPSQKDRRIIIPDVPDDSDLDTSPLTKNSTPASITAIPMPKTAEHENFQRKNFCTSQIQNGEYSRCLFEGVLLNETGFRDSTFTDCVFLRCSFFKSTMEHSTFVRCTFLDCDFSFARFSNLRLEACRFSSCIVSFASWRKVLSLDSVFDGLLFYSAQLHGCDFHHSTFAGCDFSRSTLHEISSQGLQFEYCSFVSASIRSSDLTLARFLACAMPNCLVYAVESDDRSLILKTRDQFLKAFQGLELTEQDQIFPKSIQDLAPDLMKIWMKRREILARKNSFRLHNAARLHMALEKLNPLQRDFFSLVPLLLITTVFEQKIRPIDQSIPVCRIEGYSPTPMETDVLRRHAKSDDRIPVNTPAKILQGLYTMGSTGTVAQVASSDLDYWICTDLQKWNRKEIAGFKAKLQEICLWAKDAFDLEVHFFLQDQESVRRNIFDTAHGEGSGSAQGLLLREEFYRTGLLIAGDHLVWWLVPAKSSAKQYQDIKTQTENLFPTETHLDFGHISHIPSGEFFGASLWQLVKSIKNPFKSILKFGLLENYVRRINRPLLCEELKEHVLSGWEDALHVDPYALLFREVWNYSCIAADKKALEILKIAFLEKTRLNVPELISLLGENVKDLYCADTLFQPSNHRVSGPAGVRPFDFNRLLAVEKLLNKFMIQTYARIQEGMSQNDQVRLEPEDMNRLARRIFSAFASRPGKVEKLPTFLTDRDFFDELTITSSAESGLKREWSVRGRPRISLTYPALLTEVVRKNNLAWVLVWLVANDIYQPGLALKTDFSVSPMSADDIHQLLNALFKFFPPRAVFETDIDEGLKPEEIRRAMLIINLTVPKGVTSVDEVVLCYATNWGELLCRRLDEKMLKPPLRPEEFIAEVTGNSLAKNCKIQIYTPGSSRCSRYLIQTLKWV